MRYSGHAELHTDSWLRRSDSNGRFPAYEAGEIPDFSTAQKAKAARRHPVYLPDLNSPHDRQSPEEAAPGNAVPWAHANRRDVATVYEGTKMAARHKHRASVWRRGKACGSCLSPMTNTITGLAASSFSWMVTPTSAAATNCSMCQRPSHSARREAGLRNYVAPPLRYTLSEIAECGPMLHIFLWLPSDYR